MFNPTLDTRLVIENQQFTFSPHPVVPTLVWGQEGRHAIVYRLQNNGDAFALKVFRPAFRHPGLVESARTLSWCHELPGMRVCKQTVITRDTHPEVVAKHEDLDYAMLMPWIEGPTWFDILHNRRSVTLDQSRALAESMAWVLHALELNDLAHCDLSSGNVIVTPGFSQIHLIDVEDLYSPWLTTPPFVPAGSIGYQHHEVADRGQWGPLGDRFAGAVLMAEMLGWAHPEVRRKAWGESYFSPEELQEDGERLDTLREILHIYDPGFAETFDQVWRSRSLEECPPLKTWYDLLDALPRDPVAEWAPIDLEDFREPEPPPQPAVSRPTSRKATPKKQSRQGCARRLGCRKVAIIALLLSILCCYAAVLTVEWSVLNDVF